MTINIKKKIREIMNIELAEKVRYETSYNEQALLRGVIRAEEKLIKLFERQHGR